MVATILSDKRPIIKISINNKDAYALVDTGSSLNIIDDSQLKELGASRRFKMGDAQGMGGSTEIWHVKNCLVTIEGIPINQFVSTDMSNIVDSIKEDSGVKISAILGIPAIKEAELIINPSTNEISIGYKD